MVLLDSSDNFGENEVLFEKIGAKVLDLWLDTPCLWKLVLGFWTYGLISPLPKAMCPSCSKPVFRPRTPNATALGSKVFFISSSIKFWMKQALIFKFWFICDKVICLGEGNLIFCCTGSQENYSELIGRQNNNNPEFQGRHI